MNFHNPKIKSSKISFDFDGTIDDEFDGTLNPQKEDYKIFVNL
jgi:hypothetical protein